MRDVPYSPTDPYARAQSHDFASPVPMSSVAGPSLPDGALPLDPLLAHPTSAPPYYPQPNGVNGHVHYQQQQQQNGEHSPFDAQPVASTSYQTWYGLGPQGDPFAPQLPPHHFNNSDLNAGAPPSAEQNLTTPKSSKRKKRSKREDGCMVCRGDDSKNRAGAPERLLTCAECNRRGHPSCMELTEVTEDLYNNPWRCIECKICEICRELGDDARILFCDHCDRGWHMDCLDPPLEAPPEGNWRCPQCANARHSEAPDEQQESQSRQNSQQVEEPPEMQIDPALQPSPEPEVDPALMEREPSVAASSSAVGAEQSPRTLQKQRHLLRDRRGKFRSTTLVSDDEVETETADEPSQSLVSARSRSRPNRAKVSRPRQSTEEDEQATPARSPKKLKVTVPASRAVSKHSGANRSKVLVRLKLNPKGKGKAKEEDEEDEPQRGLFDEVLDPDERDVMKTTVFSKDKERFEKARLLSDAKLVPSRQPDPVDFLSASSTTGRFPLRSTVHQLQQQAQVLLVPPDPSPSPSTPGPYPFSAKSDPNVLRIRTIRFGPFDIETWYDAPFPEEFSNIPEGRLWICEFCLKYMKSRFGAQRHMLKCKCRHPPGDEIYRDGVVSIFEVDGRRNKIYCQNLCLLSKMFLDHKSLFYDVEPFLFYVITEVDDIGARFVGYFSKEKTSTKDLNLSCIMTLPVRQRQGWGNLLIDFSYLLSRKERKVGTPERPLSALGAIGYRKYWTLAVMRYLRNAPNNPRLEDISQSTGMNLEDIYVTLAQLDFIDVHDGVQSPVRPSPGRSIRINKSRKSAVARRNLQKSQPPEDDKANKTPFAQPESYEIRWDKEEVEKFMSDWEAKGYLSLKPDKLKWIPFLVSRADRTQALQLDGASLSVDVSAVPRMATEESGITLATAASASMSATGPPSANGMDVDLETPVTPTPEQRRSQSQAAADLSEATINDAEEAAEAEAEAEAAAEQDPEETIRDDVARVAFDETATETDPGTAEQEETSVDSPSPAALFPPILPTPINALEALAAVASAVSKANPIDLFGKTLTSESHHSRGNGSWGHKNSYSESFKPPSDAKYRSLRPPPVQVHSRQSSAKPEVDSPAALDHHNHVAENSDSWKNRNNFETGSRPETPEPKREPEQRHSPPPSPPLSPRQSVEKDAEYAAQLAREEEEPRRRSLRSASTSNTTIPTLSSRDSRPKTNATRSTRQQQRKQSTSRDREASPSTPPIPVPVSPLLNGPTTRRQARDVEIATTRMTRQKSNKLGINGGDENRHVAGLRASNRLNGVVPKPPSPAKSQNNNNNNNNLSPRPKRTVRSGQKQPPSGSVASIDDDIDAEGDSDIDADGEPDEDDATILEVVEVGAGPPKAPDPEHFTSVINGVPAIPSEGSVSQPSAPGLVNGLHVHHPVPEKLDSRVVLPTLSPIPIVNGDMAMDNDEDDIDAEGEPDEDADGEPDTDIIA